MRGGQRYQPEVKTTQGGDERTVRVPARTVECVRLTECYTGAPGITKKCFKESVAGGGR